MSLHPENEKADLYMLSKRILYQSYEVTHDITAEEKKFLTEQIRRAALLAHINIAQGLFVESDKSRRKFFKTAHNGLIVVDTGLEILVELEWVTAIQVSELNNDVRRCFDTVIELLKK